MTWEIRTLKDAREAVTNSRQDNFERGYRKGYWDGVYQAIELLNLGATKRQLDHWAWNDLKTWRYSQVGFESPPVIEPWKSMRLRILERDNFACKYCGAKATQVDHVIPVSRNGTYDDENLVAVCQPCNFGKGTKLLDEWDGTRHE